MENKQADEQCADLQETPEEIEAKKQVWRSWAAQAKKEPPARRKFMEDAMTAYLQKYPEYTPE